MPIEQDLLAYHRSIGDELNISERRVRNLIGSSHWATDGEHKESILRKVISEFCPEIYRIGTGFVCYPAAEEESDKSSTQLDILITSKSNPTLYKSGELHFVTPECANAIVEVKSSLNSSTDFRNALSKLADDVSKVRGYNRDCWAGLFVYNTNMRDPGQTILGILQDISNDNILRAINCVCVGKSMFVRFWGNGHVDSELTQQPIWHSYQLTNLAQAYFINNIVSHLSATSSEHTSSALFPIEGTKEIHRVSYVYFSEGNVENFESEG